MRQPSLWSPAPRRREDRLDTHTSECGTFHEVTVSGRLTLDTSPALLDELQRVLRHSSKDHQLKVLLRDVDFIDSSGISVLIQGLKMAQERSVAYVLSDPSPKVRAVIELSQLDNFFTVEIPEEGAANVHPCDPA